MKSTGIWITAPNDPGEEVVAFQKIVSPAKTVKKAILSASSMGIYALRINGEKVGKGVLTPGWTSYRHRTQYQTYDVTSALTPHTVLEITVGQGWAVGNIGLPGNERVYADRTAVIAWLRITYTDGTTETVTTDDTWDVYTEGVKSAGIYHGETVDKTAKPQRLGKARRAAVKTKLVPQEGEWITEHEKLAPVAVLRTPKGETVLDFGQNLTGYVRLTIRAKRGARVVIHHAEVLDKDGNFYTDNFRSAKNENIYICSGGEDVFQPTYSFQGFRYIRLTEYPFDAVDPSLFLAIAVHSDVARTGRFVCGNEKIDQLYHNVIWGQKSNYLDIPTDCPQRDERLGWTGDAQIFCRTAAINFDVERFFEKWLTDVALEQKKDGSIPGIVPDCLNGFTRVSGAWGDVACVVPWELYLAYGNRKLLKKNFPMMKKWVEYMRNAGPDEYLWLGGTHYGDWLAMDAGEDSFVGATSTDLIATAFYAYSTELTVKAGRALGEDVSAYETLYQNVRTAFRAYFMENGMPKETLPLTEPPSTEHAPVDALRRGVTQTALTLILHFHLCEENEKAALAAKLAELIRENGMLMSTGFVGTPYLLHALSENGYTDLAYALLMQEKAPSWLYSVCHGATTMWEHWNSQKEDGSFWSTDMNSFNHYAYGAVYDWIFGVACGIKPTAPAYREIALAPHPDPRLGFVDASIRSRSGEIRARWYYKEDGVHYEFEIPQGVTAHLTLPSGRTADLAGGTYLFAERATKEGF